MKVEKVLTGIFEDGVLVSITDQYAAVRKNAAVGAGQFDVTGVSLAAPVKITGTPQTGETLTAVLGEGYSATGYQWKSDNSNIVGATSASYVLQAAEEGTSVTVEATGLSFDSAGVAAVAAP